MKVWETGADFLEELLADADVRAALSGRRDPREVRPRLPHQARRHDLQAGVRESDHDRRMPVLRSPPHPSSVTHQDGRCIVHARWDSDRQRSRWFARILSPLAIVRHRPQIGRLIFASLDGDDRRRRISQADIGDYRELGRPRSSSARSGYLGTRTGLITVPQGSSDRLLCRQPTSTASPPSSARPATDRAGRRRRCARNWRRYGGDSRRTTGTPRCRHILQPCRSRTSSCHQSSACVGIADPQMHMADDAVFRRALPAGIACRHRPATTSGMSSRSVAIAISVAVPSSSSPAAGRHRSRCRCLPGRSGRAPR